jgi:phospholipid N-methyltransferase
MIGKVPWEEVDVIVELGAGTGVFTEHIGRMKKPDCRALIFELDEEMRNSLRQRFPELLILDDARKLKAYVREEALPKVACVLSGLPFAVFPREDQYTIINAVKDVLTKRGVFITFQYSLQMKALLEKTFSKVEISFVPWNIPPAFVYKCTK